MLKKFLKVMAVLIAFLLIAGLLIFANGLLGNPISYYLAKKSAEKYVSENYSNEGYILTDIKYSFKSTKYIADIEVSKSEDKKFNASFNFKGEFVRSNYEDEIINRLSTWRRLEKRYRELADTVLKSSSFPYKIQTGYGTLLKSDDEYIQELTLDGIYNINQIGSEYGIITVSLVSSGNDNAEGAAKIVLELKNILEQGGVSFNMLDLTILSENMYKNGYNVCHLLYSEIYEEGLEERIQKHNEEGFTPLEVKK